jgi:major membrane immunogen (membrane-anchored lipoprotein)
MLKKLLLVFVVAVSAFLLVSCGERTYAADGVYTAFKWELHSNNGPQVTSVSVTIEKDKVVKYYIDCIQNTKTTAEDGTVSYAFNAKTKKELGNDYKMKGVGPKYEFKDGKWSEVEGKKSELEWFEQAALIEKFFLEKGPEAVETVDGRFTNVEGGVTIKDGGYSELAKEALQMAKDGVVKAWIPSGNSVVFATAKVDKNGKFTELKLDTIQGKVVDGKYVWNAKTKQELGNDYAMKGVGPKYEFKDGDWKVVADAKCEKEWFEQAKIITDYVQTNGIEELKSIKERGISKDGSTLIDAGVTIKTDDYIKVLKKLYENVKK